MLSLTVTAVLAVVVATFSGLMRDAHESVTRAATLSTSNVAASLAYDVERNTELLDRSLQGVVRSWADPRVQALPSDVRDMVLFDHSASAAGFGAIAVLDKTGSIVASSKPLTTAPVSNVLRNRDYFLVHAYNHDIGLFVSRPFISSLNKDLVIGLSRRISGSDGSFDGVVVGTLRVSYLESLFRSVDLGPNGDAALLRLDGTVVAKVPSDQAGTQLNIHADNDRFDLLRVQSAGTVIGASPLDGTARITSFKRVGHLPLIQIVEFCAQDVYADWRHKLLVLGLMLGMLSLGTLVLIVLLNKELIRRTKAEDDLNRLAGTDPLTSLANRRRFDEVFSLEWRTAQREGTSLALLMIDADEFKRYNDTLGHPAGDETLRLIAECVNASVGRPGDLPCRFGGEEFAVLLPRTDDAGALTVGETVRRAIQGLDRAHPGSHHGAVTVSVGAASMRPRQGQTVNELVKRADQALYQAKGGGRNRVCVHSGSGLTLVA